MNSSKFIFNELNKEFKTFASIEKFNGIKISKILPEENHLNFLSENQKKKVNKFYEEQIENMEINFKSQIMKTMPGKVAEIDKYFKREDFKVIASMKNLVWISSFLIGIYNERNEIVLNLIKAKKSNKECIINEISL